MVIENCLLIYVSLFFFKFTENEEKEKEKRAEQIQDRISQKPSGKFRIIVY